MNRNSKSLFISTLVVWAYCLKKIICCKCTWSGARKDISRPLLNMPAQDSIMKMYFFFLFSSLLFSFCAPLYQALGRDLRFAVPILNGDSAMEKRHRSRGGAIINEHMWSMFPLVCFDCSGDQPGQPGGVGESVPTSSVVPSLLFSSLLFSSLLFSSLLFS